MTRAIRTLVAVEDGFPFGRVETIFPAGPVEVVGVLEGLDRNAVSQRVSDVLVVACGSYSERALDLIGVASAGRPERPVVVLYDGTPNGFMERAFEAGAEDIIVLPQSQDAVRFALEKAIARKRGATAATAVGAMICVLGPKGGTGKTLVACNLATALAQAGARAALVDLDLQFGDVGIAFGLSPDRTIYDLARAGGSLDAEKLSGYLMEHKTGVSALLAPTRPDQAASVDADLLREIYPALRTSYDFVIVDTPPGFTPEVIASIDSSSHVCVVGMLDALSLKDTKLGLETLELMGYSGDIRLVLNRAGSSVGISMKDVEQVLGRRPDIFVPSDRAVPRAITAGQPIVAGSPRSGPARAFGSLARLYLDDRTETAEAAKNAERHHASGNGRRKMVAGLLRRRPR